MTGRDGQRRPEQLCRYTIPCPTADRLVLATVCELLDTAIRPALRREMETVWALMQRGADGAGHAGRVAVLAARAQKWRTTRTAAYADWKTGEIDADEYASIRATAAGEIGQCEAEIARLAAEASPEARLPSLDQALASVGD